MKYRINPQAAFGLNFSVPAAVTDQHLKMAGASQLKALLWLLRHNGDSSTDEDMCKALGLSQADVNDAMQYWLECGLAVSEDSTPVAQAASTKPGPEPQTKPVATETVRRLAPLPEAKPTHELIVKRMSESEEIRFLFTQAQISLGRTIGHDTQAALLMIHDTYGLPVEVILMMIDYCVSVGKRSLGYMEKMAKSWGEEEIDTIEKADERIRRLRRVNESWDKFKEMTGINTPKPTAKQSEYLAYWTEKLGFDLEMIYLAYEEMADHTEKISFPYIDKVLRTWHDSGIKTEADVAADKAGRAQSKAEKPDKKKNAGYDPSYDLESFVRQSMNDEIVYKK